MVEFEKTYCIFFWLYIIDLAKDENRPLTVF